ncbi:MAG: phosphoesterase PA-phosphatase related protein [Gammaproteobacteria bacterium]|nr:phosphoesterase PA-phosphatase related protein [Gammaproteobacteria bacterium]
MSGLMRCLRWAGIIVGVAGFLSGCATVSGRKQGDTAVANAGSNASGGTDASTGPNAGTSTNASSSASASNNAGAGTDTVAQKSANTTTNTGSNAGPGANPGPNANYYSGSPADQHPLLHDIEAYYTSPLRWDVKDWAFFAGAVGLVAGAHHYDTQVRTHFIKQGVQPIGGSTKDLQDAAPAAAAVVGTWLYANLIDSSDGHREAWNMVEAGGLASVTTYALKYVAARERPDQTSDPNKWRASGSSFPSFHAAAAFAVGSVLAESGNDEYRWIRRFLGYGAIAGFTAYERLKHNAHWLSDDVAGAAIGGATAHFVLERDAARREARKNYSVSLVPLEGGAMLTYSLTIQ